MTNSIKKLFFKRRYLAELAEEAWRLEIEADYQESTIADIAALREATSKNIEKHQEEAKALEESHKREDRDRLKELTAQIEKERVTAQRLQNQTSTIQQAAQQIRQRASIVLQKYLFIKNR